MSNYKENIPTQFIINKINTLPVSKLMPVAKIVCKTDCAVTYYQNKNHPQFYHNQDALRKALRRCFSIGAFNHREIIIQKLNLEYEYMRAQIEKYSQIVENNQEEIIKLVNNDFEENKKYIKTKILKEIRGYIENSDCVHYEWKRGDCPYDSSGILVENGTIDLHQTIYEFLNEEYCG